MADPQKALQTQIANIEKKTGQSMSQLREAIAASGRTAHGDIRAWLMTTYGLGHGDANTVAHLARAAASPADAGGNPLDDIYAGPKAHLRAIHDAVMAVVGPLGAFEIAPKKGYVSLRRKKQFAMVGPKSKDRVELGINLKEDVGSARVVAQKPGGMCQFAVSLSTPGDVDAEVVTVLTKAFTAAG
ncbi:MAG: DUF5655 domain-containing protein [Vicinamibacterales bacterium]